MVEIDARDDDGRKLRYRLSVFYGKPTGGTLCAGSDAAVARWVALCDLETLTITRELRPFKLRQVAPRRACLAFAAKKHYSKLHE